MDVAMRGQPVSIADRRKHRKLTLFLVLVGLQIADVITTKVALAAPSNWEMNPAMAWCMTNLGAFGWIAPKVALVAFGALILRKLPRWPLTFAVTLYVAIVANNLLAIILFPPGGTGI
jgi:hypothetical protein